MSVVVLPALAALALQQTAPNPLDAAEGVPTPLYWGMPLREDQATPIGERRVAFAYPFTDEQLAWIAANLPDGGQVLDELPSDWRHEPPAGS